MTVSSTDRAASIARLRRLAVDGRVSNQHVRDTAARLGVTPRTVRRWLTTDPHHAPERAVVDIGSTTAPVNGARTGANARARFEITPEHLLAYADSRSVREAYRQLARHGQVDCSYATFARALARVDPARRYGALEGFPGMSRNWVYLRTTSPHRNHSLHVDHTHADVRVLPDHRARTAIRPYLTVAVDAATSLVHAFLWKTPVNTDLVAAALAEVATERDYHGVTLGGVPEQVVFDNGAENYAAVTHKSADMLGWVVSPIPPYSSWLNGKAERAIQLVNSRLTGRAPGALHVGTTQDGKRRVVANLPKDTDLSSVWTWHALNLALTEVVDEINTGIPVKELGGLTRLQAYAADPTEQRFLDPAELRAAMMPAAKDTCRATKNGIHFDNGQYVSADLRVGTDYRIRHMARSRDFIEVFDTSGEHVARAWKVDVVPKSERDAILAKRARHSKELNRVNESLRIVREQRARSGNAIAAAHHADGNQDDDGPDGATTPVVPEPVVKLDRRKRRTAPAAKPPAPAPALPAELLDRYGDDLPD